MPNGDKLTLGQANQADAVTELMDGPGSTGGTAFQVISRARVGIEVLRREPRRGASQDSDGSRVVLGLQGTAVKASTVRPQTYDDDNAPEHYTGNHAPQDGSNRTIGVEAEGDWGMFAHSRRGRGIYAHSAEGVGAYARSIDGVGVDAGSVANHAVLGTTKAEFEPGKIQEPGFLVRSRPSTKSGVHGKATGGTGVWGHSDAGVGVYGTTGKPNGMAGVFEGALTCTGTKSAAVDAGDGTHRLFYSLESPESYFEDFGSGRLKQGRATVVIEPEFGKCVQRSNYFVFLTPEGDCQGLYVAKKGPRSFEVRELGGGLSAVRFSYRIVARRGDVKAKRLARVVLPEAPAKRAKRPRAR